jgi:hypothetical protein
MACPHGGPRVTTGGIALRRPGGTLSHPPIQQRYRLSLYWIFTVIEQSHVASAYGLQKIVFSLPLKSPRHCEHRDPTCCTVGSWCVAPTLPGGSRPRIGTAINSLQHKIVEVTRTICRYVFDQPLGRSPHPANFAGFAMKDHFTKEKPTPQLLHKKKGAVPSG